MLNTIIEWKGKHWTFEHDGADFRQVFRIVKVVNAPQPYTVNRKAGSNNLYWLTKMWRSRSVTDREFSDTVAAVYRDKIDDGATEAVAHRAAEDFRRAAILLRAKVARQRG